MIVDCDRCEVRGLACDDCVVSVLLGPPRPLDVADDERRAVDVLATSGLVPPLRYETDRRHEAELRYETEPGSEAG